MKKKIKNIRIKLEIGNSWSPKISFLDGYKDDWFVTSQGRTSAKNHVVYVQLLPFVALMCRWDTVLQLPKKANRILATELLLDRSDNTFDYVPWGSSESK